MVGMLERPSFRGTYFTVETASTDGNGTSLYVTAVYADVKLTVAYAGYGEGRPLYETIMAEGTQVVERSHTLRGAVGSEPDALAALGSYANFLSDLGERYRSVMAESDLLGAVCYHYYEELSSLSFDVDEVTR